MQSMTALIFERMEGDEIEHFRGGLRVNRIEDGATVVQV